MAFDLGLPDAKAAAERGIPVDIMDPADADKPLFTPKGEPLVIHIIGADSAKVRKKTRTTLDKHFERIRKGKPSGGAEESEQEVIDRLAAATLSWNFVTPSGEPVACTEENAKAIYGDPRYPYLVEQLDKAIGDRSRFFATSSPN